MLAKETNERLTKVGPGTPMGNLYRRYWIPFALHRELPVPDGDPLRVRLLGEDLIAFRDSDGKVGLIDALCPHRRAPMFLGRNEKCGLRCVYHGWKFDTEGQCVDMPNEPAESNYKNKVRSVSYPCWEAGGIVWTYMGPEEKMPPKPDYEWLRAPESHRFVSKTYQHCNFLQALEGGIDTSHVAFLHDNDFTNRDKFTKDTSPKLEVEKTAYGFRYAGIRNMGEEGQYIRAYQFIMPSQQIRGGVTERSGKRRKIPVLHGHIWVPVDDHHCYVYNTMYAYDKDIPLTPEYIKEYESRAGRGADDYLPGYPAFRLKARAENDYMIDREEQRIRTFTGIKGVNTQDVAVQELMGPIVNRSQEKLGTADLAIIAARQLLLEAIDAAEKGGTIRGIDPAPYRHIRTTEGMIGRNEKWQEALKDGFIAVY